ncbi:LOW QUALITY PROTEIN: uncharacterized protein ACN427_013555 [Glossina fuscipes fuscipes]
MSSLSYLDLSGNTVRSLTLNSFNRCRTLQHRKMAANLLVDIETGEQVELSDNLWSCKWLAQELRKPKSKFGQPLEVNTTWSVVMPKINSVGCYDENVNRKSLEETNAASPLVWTTIKMNKFDSRSVVIRTLIAITLAFSALRISRKLVDRKEQQIKLQRLIAKLFSDRILIVIF